MSSALFWDVTQLPTFRDDQSDPTSRVKKYKNFKVRYSEPLNWLRTAVPPYRRCPHALPVYQQTAQTPNLAQLLVLYKQPELHSTLTGSLFTCLVTSVGSDTPVTVEGLWGVLMLSIVTIVLYYWQPRCVAYSYPQHSSTLPWETECCTTAGRFWLHCRTSLCCNWTPGERSFRVLKTVPSIWWRTTL
jgi:hypothetical protein